MELTDLIARDAILPAVKAGSKKQILQEIAAKAREAYGLDTRLVVEGLLAREKLGSTAMGGGVAIPPRSGDTSVTMRNITGFTETLIATLLLAAASTLADLIWALWIPAHRAVFGLIHGALLFMVLGLVLGILAAIRWFTIPRQVEHASTTYR